MLANKILDDQSELSSPWKTLPLSPPVLTPACHLEAYTAQTWSQVSSLELVRISERRATVDGREADLHACRPQKPLVAGEVEFLRGLDWSLHVSEGDYNAWLRLLQGHVASRNARLGKTPPLQKSAFATPSRRTAGSKRVRHSATRVHPCGLGLGLEQVPQPVAHPLSPEEDPFEGSRRTRRKLDLSTSTRTPLSLSPPYLSHMPASAPVGSTAASAPLPVYGHGDRNHLSDLALLSPSSRLRGDSRSSLSSSLGKRSAGEAFGRFSVGSSSASDLKGPSASVDFSAESMARSYSAGPISYPSVPVPGQTMYGAKAPPAWACAPPLQPVPFLFSVAGSAASSPLYSRPSSSSSAHGGPAPAYFGGAVLPPHFAAVGAGGFPTLVDSFAPRYDPEHYRQLQQGQLELGYYALAAGQGLGYYQTMHPVPVQTQPVWANPFAQYPALPVHPAYSHSVSAASSPVLRASSRWQSPPYVMPLMPQHHAVPPPPPPSAAYACSPLSTRPILPPLSNSHRRVSAETASSPIGSTTSTPQSLSAPTAPPSVHPSWLAPPPPGASHLTPVRALQQGGYGLPPTHGAHPVLPYGLMQPMQHWSAYSNAGIPGVYWRG